MSGMNLSNHEEMDINLRAQQEWAEFLIFASSRLADIAYAITNVNESALLAATVSLRVECMVYGAEALGQELLLLEDRAGQADPGELREIFDRACRAYGRLEGPKSEPAR